MRFPTRAPSFRCSLPCLPRLAAGGPWRLLDALLVAVIPLLFADSGFAEEFELGKITDNVDLALGAGREPTGELVANFALAGLDLGLSHTEVLGGMARPWHYEKPTTNPLARSSLVNGATKIDLAPGASLPLGLSFGLDERAQGHRDVRWITHSGLHLQDLRLDHRLTFTTALTADGAETRSGAGRLVLGFNLFGGWQEGAAEYGAGPDPRLTQLRMNSEWQLGEAATAVVGVTHRSLEGVSQARLGFRRPVGAFKMTSDVVADNAGSYAVGLRFSMPLNAAPTREAWSLSTLVANLRAERQPAVPVLSEPTSSADAN